MVNLLLYMAPTIFFLILIPILGIWGARRVRRDIFRLAGVKDEEETEGEDREK